MIEDREVEADVEARFVRVVEGHGWEVRKLEWVGRRGAPDRICFGPGGQMALAELKNGTKGRLSPHQRREHAALSRLGHQVWVICDNADIEAFAREVLQ